MDPLTIVGAAASVGQLIDLADKAATSALNLTRSIFNAPKEIGQLAANLERFKFLVQQTQNQTLDASSIDDLFPSDHRDFLYSLLESNVKALDNLRSLQGAHSISSTNVGRRVRWAAVDKRKARDLLDDIRDVESSLDTALSVVAIRLASKNQASLAALRTSQEMLQPSMADGLTMIKHYMNDQLSQAVDKIAIRAEQSVGNSHDEVKAGFNEVVSLLKTVVASGDTHTEMVRNLTDGHRELSRGMNCLSNSLAEQPGQALASRRRMKGAGHFEGRTTRVRAQQSSVTDRDGPAGSSSLSAPYSSVSTELLSYEMTRTRKSIVWNPRSSDSSFTNESRWPTLDLSVMFASSQTRRKLRLVLRAGLRLIRQHVIQFDMRIQHDAKHWMSLPRLGLSLRPIYMRPVNSPIFKACHKLDLEAVRYLLDTGQATIYDVDDESRCGLLEHAFQTMEEPDFLSLSIPNYSKMHNSKVHHSKMHLLMRYLLDVGYDPNFFNGINNSLPAILKAFRCNQLDFVTQLIYRGAEIDSFSVNPIETLSEPFMALQPFVEGLNLLISTGFSDWGTKSISSLLYGAARAGDWRSFLFALEMCSQANILPTLVLRPLVSVHHDEIAMMSALLESGANIDAWTNGRVGFCLCHSLRRSRTAVAHSVLYRSRANSHLPIPHPTNVLHEALLYLSLDRQIQFFELELLLTHLLLHGADPFEPVHFARDIWGSRARHHPSGWYSNAMQLYSVGISKRFTSSFSSSVPWSSDPWKLDIAQNHKAVELVFTSSSTIEWSYNRRFVQHNLVPHDDRDSNREDELSDQNAMETPDNCKHGIKSGTLFYQNISTEEGRQRMSTFPVVQLLCNALIRAGYRAEMDSEGDIWFDDEDKDMYYDALEFQSDSEGHKPQRDCYICQDMRKYGLGEVPDKIERGKQKLYAYREELKAGRSKWYM